MKLRKIKIAIALMMILSVSILNAQETKPAKVKEFGIGIASLNNFSLQYRWGNEKTLYRIMGSISGSKSDGNSEEYYKAINNDSSWSGNINNTNYKSPFNLNCGLSFSMLKIKPITDKFSFMYGGILGVSYSYSNNQTTTAGTSVSSWNNPYPNSSATKQTSTNVQPSLGFVIGAVYKINASFLLYAEIAPNIYYSYRKITEETTYNNQPNQTTTDNVNLTQKTYGFSNLSNSGALLSIVYRF